MKTSEAQDRCDHTQPDGVGYSVVAIAASAGGLTAISQVLSNLPTDFPAPIVIVQHLHPKSRSFLADILRQRTRLRVKQAEDGDHILPGVVYVAAPDHHLLINPAGTLSLSKTAKVHFVRPSADLLFQSAANSYGNHAIAVVLSGTGSDGVIGVQVMKEKRGTVIVQDKETAEFSGMPAAAIATGQVDFILPLSEVAPMLIRLTAKRETQ